MVFPPAEQGQYDVWNNFNNNDPNWTLLPYFKRSERFIPPNHEQLANGVRYLSEVHGTFDKERDGGVKVGYPRYPIYFFPQSTMWREAASSFRPSPDLAKGDPQGTLSL